MSGLTDADREALRVAAADAAWAQFVRMTSSNPGDLTHHAMKAVLPIVEAITTRAVNAALTEAADAIKAVPAMYGSDNYLQALTRAECIVRARIT